MKSRTSVFIHALFWRFISVQILVMRLITFSVTGMYLVENISFRIHNSFKNLSSSSLCQNRNNFVILEKLPRTFQHFMEPKGSSKCTHEHTTGRYPKPHQSIPFHPPTSWSSYWSPSFWFSTNILYAFLFSPIHATMYMPCPSHPRWLDHSNCTWRRVQAMKLLIMQFSPTKYSPQHPQSMFLL
jgi:hypothetical protein